MAKIGYWSQERSLSPDTLHSFWSSGYTKTLAKLCWPVIVSMSSLVLSLLEGLHVWPSLDLDLQLAFEAFVSLRARYDHLLLVLWEA